MKIAVLIDCLPEFEASARYAMQTLLDVAGLPCQIISNPPDDDAGPLLFYGPEDHALPQADVVIARERTTLSPRNQREGPTILPDIVHTTFRLLTQREGDNKVLTRPLVNAYAGQLLGTLVQIARRKRYPLLQIWPWPHNAPYAVTLSHDVDQTELHNPRNGLLVLRRALQTQEWRGLPRGIYYLARGLWGRLARPGADPAWHFEQIMAAEEAAGYRSSFYFVPLVTSGGCDPAYSITDPRLQDVIHQLYGGGWEVGVHGSFHSSKSVTQLRREREHLESILNAPVTGIRQHYLRFSVPETFHHQAAAGYLYDTSVGYNHTVGFRAGIAAPFHPFDETAGAPLDLLELPLAVMDGPLFLDLGYSSSEAVEQTMALLQDVHAHHGLATLLWHQRVGDEKRYPGWWQAYRSILDCLQTEDTAWVATGAEVARWWSAREKVQIDHQVDAEGRVRWTCVAPQEITGLTLRVRLRHSSALIVTGAQAEIQVDEKGTAVVQLEHLSEGQHFALEEK